MVFDKHPSLFMHVVFRSIVRVLFQVFRLQNRVSKRYRAMYVYPKRNMVYILYAMLSEVCVSGKRISLSLL